MKHFTAILFDMDGLLLDSERLSFEIFQSICARLDLGDRSILFKQCLGVTDEVQQAILKQGLKGLIDPEAFQHTWHTEYKQVTTNQAIPLKTGVKALLAHIMQLNIPMAVVTSTRTESAQKKLSAAGILHYFDHITGGDQVAQSKPHPEIYGKAAAKIGVKPSQCLAFEDSNNGVKAAVSAGMTVVQIPDLAEPTDDIIALGHIILPSLNDVFGYEFVMDKT